MKIGIMQPYFLPYIGYFQLVKAVDRFVFYDDVNYIKQGWVNRNNILIQGNPSLFTVPLEKSSSNLNINEISIHERLGLDWKKKFLKSLDLNYKKATYFHVVYPIIEKILDNENLSKISILAQESIIQISRYLNLNTEFVTSSEAFENQELHGVARVLDICKLSNSQTYINPIGGRNLYSKDVFLNEDISLVFIKSKDVEYVQFGKQFVPWLSIIDVLMFNSIEEVNNLLNKYELIE
jgi:hypothetical protein